MYADYEKMSDEEISAKLIETIDCELQKPKGERDTVLISECSELLDELIPDGMRIHEAELKKS